MRGKWLAISATAVLLVTSAAGAPPALAASPVDGRLISSTFEPVSGTAPPVPEREQTGKLDSAMSAVATAAGDSVAGGLERAREASIHTSRGRVQALLTIERSQAAAVGRGVGRAAGEVTGTADGGRIVQVLLPPNALAAVAELPGVLAVRRAAMFAPVAGSQMTQGDAALNGAAWRTAGATGSGVKVGIIDVGFKGYSNLLGSDLPASVTLRNFVDGQSTSNAGGEVHGTACAEVIHDIAPGAQLYLARVGTTVDLAEAADWLQANGVKIISSSIGTYNVSPGDGTGILEDIVSAKRAAGMTWFTAASNDREAHWGGAANIGAGGFHVFDAGSGQDINWFGPGNGQAYSISSGFPFEVHLRWSDWTNVSQDYDVYLVRWNGSSWQLMSQAGGTDEQSGLPGQAPVETAIGTTSGGPAAYGFVVHRYSGSAPVNLEVFAPQIPLDRRVEARSLSNLADAASAVTVGAVDVSSFVQESYSSEGPTNGPGGTAAGGLLKPDIAAYANVNTVSYGSNPSSIFNGTSAATPHVAGAAALVRQANPSFTPNQLEDFLLDRALDLGATGPDTDYGHGRLHLGTPPQLGDAAPPTVTAPNVNFRTGVNVAARQPKARVSVGFTVSDASGIASTQLQQKVDAGSFSTVGLPSSTATSVNLRLATSKTTQRQFRARATDGAGNTSAYASGPQFRLRAYQNGNAAIVQSGSWTTASNSKHFGGSVRHTNVAGRQQSLTAPMADIAIVSLRGPTRGIAQVFVDGVQVATVDLYSPTKQFRRVIWAMDFGSAATHTVSLRVTGNKSAASTGTRVDFDAFLVMLP